MPTDQWNSTTAVAAGGPPTGRLLSAANGAPQSDNGTPGFSRHGCVNTLETGEKKNNGEKGVGGR